MKDLEIISGAEYLMKLHSITEEGAYTDRYNVVREILDEIVALEMSIDLWRSTPGGYGHIVDSLYPIRRRLIEKYEQQGTTKYKYYNEEI